jgi:hypothetical protein
MFSDRGGHLELKYCCLCRLHGASVAEMPLIATCSENRQQGMCRQLVDYIEEVRMELDTGASVICLDCFLKVCS